MRRLLEKQAVRYLGTKLNVNIWRHVAIAIGRRYLYELFGTGDDGVRSYGDSDTEDEDIIPNHVFDLQAGHSSFTVGIIYGREIQ